MKKSVISLHIGQAGLQMGHAIWELLAVEHGIRLNGTMANQYLKHGAHFSTESFFTSTGANRQKYMPNAIFLDTDHIIIDEIRTGSYRNLFHPDYLISGVEDASSMFPRGYTTAVKDVLCPTIDSLRVLAENIDNLHGLILYRSFGGGTGSGTTARILDEVENDIAQISIVESTIYPAPCLSTSIVEPYNTVLTVNQTMRHVDISMTMDNQALYEICNANLDIDKPSYCDINRIVATVISTMTTSLRFDSIITSDFNIFQMNLVPYPGLKYPIVSYAPLVSQTRQTHQSLNIAELTEQVFKKNNFLIKCHPEYGEYMACVILYRGEGCQARETSIGIDRMKSNPLVKFVDWCPTGFKVVISHQRPPFIKHTCISKVDRAVCLLANSTCIVQVFDHLLQKFDLLYKSKAYVHWFTGEGLEEAEMMEARHGIVDLLMEYTKQNTKTDV